MSDTLIDSKKEQERAALHKMIWDLANELRGAVSGWDFKQYILGILFYRFISENITEYINSSERKVNGGGESEFDYAKIPDEIALEGRLSILEEKGIFIKPSELFENVCKKAKNDENLNITLSKILKNIENSAVGTDSESSIKGLFDNIDFNNENLLGKSVAKRNERLTKILQGIASLPLGSYGDNTIDVFGDAYEYLMTMYAANAGKVGGEFFTPQEVSELLVKLALYGKKRVNKVYDPACGSGSLLLKFAKVLGKENVKNGFYGQEINPSTYNLCRINMFLHNINFDKINIACEDTLISPQHENDEPFEAIVSNPPYSISWVGDSDPILINDHRFSPAGVLAPKSKADMAFIMHSLSYLSTDGSGAIVCFPGIMYRGGAEKEIRKYLIDNNYVDSIIQLPSDLFFGTSIATCIMVIRKNKNENKTLFVDASEEFTRGAAKNKLTDTNITKIYDCVIDRTQIEHFSSYVENEQIVQNDYNLSVSTYVSQKDTREIINITELNSQIKKVVEFQETLRKQINDIINDIEDLEKSS